ncbi:hypothetical protein L614_000400000800 [Ochrobactrum sp. J50]|uniref:DUF945 domain-containing protein n=1 Tax=Brucella pseudintermedia TaxID=370111 RepID=A0ABY5UGW7_9HYPH|nr:MULTISPECIES: hypothetical protein [Brucella/Ochrobactrum group]MCO7725531.1 hypothetical protein [Brucella intermedia]NKE76928.1 hypothetical protein [Ochrobactrum sp. MC-1LL]TWG98725.1 hypothetical protein L614_000400000800 [Ochrobactrum sp. J50]UWL61020.1 hypothetical protein NIK97_04500 [Brucella pseudintermedia]WPM79217.1 hypothetical protein R5W60_08380 [Brucella pseudintermedia]
MEQAKNGTRKGGRKALWAAVAVIAIAAAGLTGYKFTLEKTITSQLEKRGGTASSVEADFLGRIHLRDVTLPLKDGSNVRIASVDGRPKFLFLTGMLNASGINTEIGNYRISIPSVAIEDANFDSAMLKDTFGNSGLTLPERVGRFSAKRLTAQEIKVVQTVANNAQNIVYKDVALEDINLGKVARYTAGSTDFDFTVEVPGEDGEKVTDKMTGTMGVAEGKDIDGVFLARLYTEKAGPDDKEAKPVYGPFSAKNIVMKTKDVTFSYDEVRSNGFSARMPAVPFTETMQKLQSLEKTDEPSPAETRELILQLTSLFETLGKGDVELIGMKIEPADASKGKGGIERIAVAFDNQKMDATIKGFDFAEGQDYMKMEEASLKGFSWATSIEALKKFASLSDDQVENFPYTTMLPEFGTLRIAGIDADLPYDQSEEVDAGEENADDAAQASTEETSVPSLPERIQFAMKSYEVALNKPYNGIPTDVRVAYEDMSLKVPAQGSDEFYQQLRKLGYDRLIISSNFEANWDEANQNLIIKDISISGKDMGSVSMSGLMGGFTKEFFSGDKVMTQVALLGLKARQVNLKIEEKGLIAKGLKMYADENNMSEDEVRSTVSLIAAAALQELTADQPQLQDVVAAFSAFLAKPNIFELVVKAKTDKGIGALEMVAASQDPLTLLDKVDIEAKTE